MTSKSTQLARRSGASRRESDAVDVILELLGRRRPDLDLRASEITARLFRLRELLIKVLDRVHAQFGLKPRMFLVLGALYRSGPPYKLAPAALVRSLAWTSAGLSQLLDRMEAGGLIRREAHPRDRRSLQVTMSRTGEDIIAAAYEAHCRTELRLLAELKESERRVLVKLLRRLLIATEGPAVSVSSATVPIKQGRKTNARR